MTVFNEVDFDDHEQIVFCSDDGVGLTKSDALNDALRLSRGTTYKAAMAGVEPGGGKSVIIGDPTRARTPVLMQAVRTRGRAVVRPIHVAEDVGTSVSDVTEIKQSTRYVVDLGRHDGGAR